MFKEIPRLCEQREAIHNGALVDERDPVLRLRLIQATFAIRPSCVNE
ncbi:hypothetical protein [Legionella bononiensis]|uniref:Uncharacterized protein n=1 Tax=Legionella bononiensis TaxID=2793102 RepID=A0ABS1WEB0_9GAMM|nr:hypothetical protein [Legionella bononiensis]MBL7527678.1 hypothetical protein [Legionella bononiensis]